MKFLIKTKISTMNHARSAELDLLDRSIPLPRLIIMLAWPAIVEQILQSAVNYIDAAMVGSIGVEATAAVGLTTSTVWMLMGFMMSVGVGYSVHMAHLLGEGDTEGAREAVRQSVLAAAVIGTALSFIISFIAAPALPVLMGAAEDVGELAELYMRILGSGYVFNIAVVIFSHVLRCAGDSRTPLKFNMLMNVINVAANFMLIYPTADLTLFGRTFTLYRAGWGIAGAAAATVLSTAVAAVCLTVILFRRNSALRISLSESFRPNFNIIRRSFALAFPVMAERLCIAFGHLLSTAMITGLGTTALASHQLANIAEAVCYLPAYGFSAAATALTAQAVGACDADRAFRAGKMCVLMGSFVMVFASIGMYVASVPMIAFFTDSADVIALGSAVLRIEAWAEPLLAASVIVSGVFRGAGDVRYPVFVSCLGMLVMRVPVTWVMINVFGLGLESVWATMIADWALRTVLFMHRLFLRREVWTAQR